jgi:tRNA-specific 2-thiouridylase
MSGGVDSSIAAALLKTAGWEVCGLHFLLPAPPSMATLREDRARRAAKQVQVPLEIVDLRDEFADRIIEPFVAGYLEGLTPNPCVRCNVLIKFDCLLSHARVHTIDCVATGHYARVGKRDGGESVGLLRGKDAGKEQSYFLHRLGQVHLSRTVFPLGEMTKEAVRQEARHQGLFVHSLPGSQEICFVPEGDYRLFVEKQRGGGIKRRGNIIDDQGDVVGKHEGAYRYTIGQRQGLGIASPRPFYVKEIRVETNELVVGRKETLFSRVVEAEQFNWVEGVPPQKLMEAMAQIRYRHTPAAGRLEVISQDRVRFIFDVPQWAITPGQALVCYTGDRVLGGGWIRRG